MAEKWTPGWKTGGATSGNTGSSGSGSSSTESKGWTPGWKTNTPQQEPAPEPTLSPSEILSGAAVNNTNIDAVKAKYGQQQPQNLLAPKTANLPKNPLTGDTQFINPLIPLEDFGQNTIPLSAFTPAANGYDGTGTYAPYNADVANADKAWEHMPSPEATAERRWNEAVDKALTAYGNQQRNVGTKEQVTWIQNQISDIDRKIQDLDLGIAETAMTGFPTTDLEAQRDALQAQRDSYSAELTRAESRWKNNPLNPEYRSPEQKAETKEQQTRLDEIGKRMDELSVMAGYATTNPEDGIAITNELTALRNEAYQMLRANGDLKAPSALAGQYAVKGSVLQGAGQFDAGVTEFLDKTIGLGGFMGEIWAMIGLDPERNPVTALNRYIHEENARNAEIANTFTQGNKTAQTAMNYGAQTVAAIPAAVLAYMTAGSSMATTAGLTTEAYLNSLSGAEQTIAVIGEAVKQMSTSPNFMASFVQESGNSYENAINSGMSEADASMYSMLYGYLAAMVEVGGTSELAGGTQQFAKEVAEGPKGVIPGLVDYAKSIVGEMGEENIQGMLERGLQAPFGVNTALWSNDPNQNAIIKPSEMLEEAKGAAVVSALMGGPGAVINTANSINANRQTNTTTEAPAQQTPTVEQPTAPTVTNSVTDVSDALLDILQNSRNAETGQITQAGIAQIQNNPALLALFNETAGTEVTEQKSGVNRDAIRNNADAVISSLTGVDNNVETTAPAVDTTPTETVPTVNEESNAPTVNTEEVANEENAPLVNAEETTPTVTDETVPNEEPVQEKAEPAEEKTAEQRQTRREKVAETLRRGAGNLSDSDIFNMLVKNRKALIDLGFDPSITDTAEQIAAVRALAEDIANNQSIPSEEAVAKIKQDRALESPEQLAKYTIEQLEEKLEAAEFEKNTEVRKAVQEEINRRKEADKKKTVGGKIDAIVKDLKKRLTQPVEKKYIPAEAVEAVSNAVNAILESKQAGRDAKTNADLERIQKKLSKATEQSEIDSLLEQRDKILARDAKNQTKFTDVQKGIEKITKSRALANDPSAAGLQAYVDAIAESVGDIPITQMNSEQLEQVHNALKVIDKYCKNAVQSRIKAGEHMAYEIATAAREETSNARSIAEHAEFDGDGKVTKGAQDAYNTLKQLFSKTNLSNLPPRVVFEFLGGLHENSTWEQIYHFLNDAQHGEQASWLKGREYFESLLLNDKGKLDEKRLRQLRQTVTIDGIVDTNGKPIKMSRGMMISLWMTMQQEAGARSVVLGGVKVPTSSEYYKGINDNGFGTGGKRSVAKSAELNSLRQQYNQLATEYESNPSESLATQLENLENEITEKAAAAGESAEAIISAIEAQMTEYDKAWCDAARKFFDWESGEMQATSERVYGFSKAMEDNYFPIARDTDFLNVTLPGIINELNLEGWGNMKSRARFASQPVMLYDIFDVCDRYNAKAAKYAQIMPAIHEFMKVWNNTDAVDKANQGGVKTVQSVKDTVRSKFGDSGVQIVENILADMQGTRGVTNNNDPSGILKFINRTRSHAASGTLTFNFGVAGAQKASIPTAFARIPGRYLAKALVTHDSRSRADIEAVINENSPYYKYRQRAGNPIKEDARLAQRAVNGLNKMGNLFNMISESDLGAVRFLWRACEFAAEDAGFERGTEAFNQYATQMWETSLEDTQPMATTLQRPDQLRNPNDLMKTLTMYKTVPRQNFGLAVEGLAYLNQARVDLQEAKRSGNAEAIQAAEAAYKNAGKKAARNLSAVFAGNATYVLMRTLVDGLMHKWDKFRDKETGEITGEAVAKRLAWMMGETTAGMVPFGNLLFGALELGVTGEYYFGISMTGIDSLADAVQDSAKLAQAVIQGKDSDVILQYSRKVSEEMTEIFSGLPARNIDKFVTTITDWAGDIANAVKTDDVLGEFYEFTAAQNQNRLYDALLDENFDKADRVMGSMERTHDEAYAKEQARDVIKDHFVAGDIDYNTAKDMLVRTGHTEKESDTKILEWYANDLYENDIDEWEKHRTEHDNGEELDDALYRLPNMESYNSLSEDQQKDARGDIYGFYKHLAKKEFAEENGIEYENQNYEKYEGLEDPVDRIILENKLNPAIKKDKKDPSVIADPDVVDALVGDYISGNMSEEDMAWFEEHDYMKDLIAGAELAKPIGAEDYFDILAFVNQMSKWNTEAKKGPEQRDEEMIDSTLALIAPLLESDDARAIFNDSFAWTDELLDAREIGMGSELFFKYFDQYNIMKEDKSLSADQAYNKMYKIVEDADDLTREQKEFLHDRFPWTRFVPVRDTTFEKMVDRGMPTDYAEKYVDAWAEAKEQKNADLKPGETEKTLSATEKARVIWSDTTLSVNDRLQMLDYSNILPSQHDFAVWLSTSGLPKSEIYRWWSIIGAKNTPKPWATSYDKALKKKS